MPKPDDRATMSQMPTHEGDPGSREFTPTVAVRGEAVLRAEPDEAMLWITLTALEKDAGQALADVSRRSEQLPAMLDDVGVANTDRSTTGVTVYEEFDHTPSGRRSLGHRAAASTSVRLTGPEPIGKNAPCQHSAGVHSGSRADADRARRARSHRRDRSDLALEQN